MNSIEIWKPVVGFEGVYEVSDHGRVRSLDRLDLRGYRLKGKLRALATSPKGYKKVHLRLGGRDVTRLVHHMVLEAFIGEKPSREECRHLNGNPADNHLSNLAWGTPAENSRDTITHGTHPWARRAHCKRGHLLGGKNVSPAEATRGGRSCYACQRENVISRRDGRPFSQKVADENFARFTGSSISSG